MLSLNAAREILSDIYSEAVTEETMEALIWERFWQGRSIGSANLTQILRERHAAALNRMAQESDPERPKTAS